MTRLAGAIDGVIGVDTHRDTLAAAATDPVGGLLAQTSVRTDAAGYRRLLDFARAQVPGRRCWVVEVGRPQRPQRRAGAKSDALDAVRAAREVLAHDYPLAPVAVATGRRCGCCWPPATAPVWPRSAPPISSRH